ncbi:MAG: hypothetical protein JO356_17365 [Acidobacteria bacterium]|nr:hypothetical protein [Acidobacteriota bacterium]
MPATDFHVSLTQSKVGSQFAMGVPLFADFGKGMVRIGQLRIVGSTTLTGDLLLPARPKSRVEYI